MTGKELSMPCCISYVNINKYLTPFPYMILVNSTTFSPSHQGVSFTVPALANLVLLGNLHIYPILSIPVATT
jgi:hypothetical protein